MHRAAAASACTPGWSVAISSPSTRRSIGRRPQPAAPGGSRPELRVVIGSSHGSRRSRRPGSALWLSRNSIIFGAAYDVALDPAARLTRSPAIATM